MRNVEVVAHHEAWSKQFEQKKTLLKDIFGAHLLGIHHIRSTAVKGTSGWQGKGRCRRLKFCVV